MCHKNQTEYQPQLPEHTLLDKMTTPLALLHVYPILMYSIMMKWNLIKINDTYSKDITWALQI